MAEKKIICGLPNRDTNNEETCTGVVAHVVSPRMMTLRRRSEQSFSLLINGDGSMQATCPKCGRIHSFVWRAGELNTKDLKLEDVEVSNPAGNPADPNDPNNTNPPVPEPVTPTEPAPAPVE